MNKLSMILVTGAAIVGFAAPASAEVGGGRVEAIVGWDHTKIGLDDFGFDDSFNRDGVLFGIGAGYDFAVNPGLALGVDLEATESTADLEVSDGTDSAELSVGRDLYVGGRLTFAVSPNANVYVTGGYSNARFKAETDIGGTVDSEAANADGIRGGIGAQFAIGGNAYVGGEYRYSNYEADIERHQAVATLGFRF